MGWSTFFSNTGYSYDEHSNTPLPIATDDMMSDLVKYIVSEHTCWVSISMTTPWFLGRDEQIAHYYNINEPLTEYLKLWKQWLFSLPLGFSIENPTITRFMSKNSDKIAVLDEFFPSFVQNVGNPLNFKAGVWMCGG